MSTEYRSRLEQPPTFKKLMGELIVLFAIAGRASQHNIIDIVSRGRIGAAHRNRVFKMVDVRATLARFKSGISACGIVAPIALGFQLLLNLLGSEGTTNANLSRSMPLTASTSYHSPALSLPVLFFSLIVLFPMGNRIGFLISTYLLSVPLIPTPLLFTYLFLMDLLTVLLVFEPFLTVKFIVLLFLRGYLFFMRVCIRLVPGFFAFFAFSAKSIPTLSEKFRGCRIRIWAGSALFAGYIILGYSVTHKGHSLSRLGMYQHRSGTTLLPLDYSTNPPLMQLCEVLL